MPETAVRFYSQPSAMSVSFLIMAYEKPLSLEKPDSAAIGMAQRVDFALINISILKFGPFSKCSMAKVVCWRGWEFYRGKLLENGKRFAADVFLGHF
jgi:hypothetical protein